jgi:ATP-dependent protease ClpP protease subunit
MSSFSMGTLKNIEEDVNECKRIQKIIEKMVLCKTKISKKKIKEIYAKKNDWFITSKEAKHFNIVDEVL